MLKFTKDEVEKLYREVDWMESTTPAQFGYIFEKIFKHPLVKQKMEDFYTPNYKLEGYQPVGKPSNPPEDE